MTESNGLFENVLRWLRAGYPDGVPPKDYYPVLALLKRSLTEDEVVEAARATMVGPSPSPVSGMDACTVTSPVALTEPEPVIRAVTYIIPARYFVSTLQSLFLAGNIPVVLVVNVLFLIASAVMFIGLTWLKTKRRLD